MVILALSYLMQGCFRYCQFPIQVYCVLPPPLTTASHHVTFTCWVFLLCSLHCPESFQVVHKGQVFPIFPYQHFICFLYALINWWNKPHLEFRHLLTHSNGTATVNRTPTLHIWLWIIIKNYEEQIIKTIISSMTILKWKGIQFYSLFQFLGTVAFSCKSAIS